MKTLKTAHNFLAASRLAVGAVFVHTTAEIVSGLRYFFALNRFLPARQAMPSGELFDVRIPVIQTSRASPFSPTRETPWQTGVEPRQMHASILVVIFLHASTRGVYVQGIFRPLRLPWTHLWGPIARRD